VHSILEWLTRYEAVAVWLEGVALVAILVADLWTSHRDREETIAQLKLAQKQIEASHNAERAWVMTELGTFYSDGRVRITQTISEPAGPSTQIPTKLTCRNEGRSPAWIDGVKGYAEIVDNAAELGNVVGQQMESFGWIGPLAPGKLIERSLEFNCSGHPNQDQFISVYVVVEYRDIFENRRATSLGYSVDLHGNVYRQEALPERSRNT
jgi:hypothetical protein